MGNTLSKATDCCENRHQHTVRGRSWRSIILRIFFGIFLAVLTLITSSSLGLEGAPVDLGHLGLSGSITLPLFLLVLLVFIARPIFLLFDDHYEVGCHHLLAISGRCSFHKERVVLPFEDILGVRVTQGIFDRLLNVGMVSVWTATSGDQTIKMHGLYNPDDFASKITEKIDNTHIRKKQSN